MRVIATITFVLAPILLVAGIGLVFGREWGVLFIYAGVASAAVGGAAVLVQHRARSHAMETLAALRTKGVEIRNRGLLVTKSAQLDEWLALRDAWHAEALAAVVKLNRHESMAFETLGNFMDHDIIRGTYVNPEHTRQVAFMTADLRRLEEIRQRYT
jgi:hypothetical protein